MKSTNEFEYQDVFKLIYQKMSYLNPALRRVANYIIENPQVSKNTTIKDMSMACDVSESTITRFVRELGLNSFRELKILIAETLTYSDKKDEKEEEKYVYEDISRDDSIDRILDKVIYRHTQTLSETRKLLNAEALDRAVKAIENAKILMFSCMGSSSVAGLNGVMRFTRAGKPSTLLNDYSIQLMTSAIATPETVVIGISNSGRSKPVIESLKLAQSKGAFTIGITSFEDAPINKYSDEVLFTSTKSSNEVSALDWEAVTSKTAQIIVVDTLYACFAAKHFDETLNHYEDTYNMLKVSRER
ncbi:MurR/RpiR family transcriptional regulator [Bacillus sp. AFS055030]|uniref:MurR/RpiR family transcriptional regulator n=1 Tax=Bacillus sp. AFS055030 TaxID=2033507 RepID=UPI000BFE18AD|nr:MurR/RpiR family transcriptional regulator [Bacillus sp. AFS055030]PGL70999.1 RpiR family transcriptional regulator [Bacillus sp. AFS055030]